MQTHALILLLVTGALGLAAISTLVAMFFTVEQRTTAIVQQLGKFVRQAGPGPHGKVPFMHRRRAPRGKE